MRFFLAASILFATIATASADAPAKPQTAPTAAPDVKKMHTDDCARARAQNKTCIIDMKGEEVDGNSPGAGGIGIAVIETTQHDSLIHIRRDFIEEILKSAEDLQ